MMRARSTVQASCDPTLPGDGVSARRPGRVIAAARPSNDDEPEEEGVTLSRSDLRVRTLRVATGAHFLSFVTGPDASGPTLPEELERLPPSADLVINVEGLDSDGARAVAAVLKESGRGRQSPGDTIIVAEKESVRRVLRRSGVGRQLLIEHSLDDAVRYVLGRALLETVVLGGSAP
jgi:anti-anti-sigma regulatory factor